jgi:hypothetical protein
MALNPGDLKMYSNSSKFKKEKSLTPIEEDENNSLTWHDAPLDLVDIHEAERIKDRERHNKYIKREKTYESDMKAKDQHMKENFERLMRPSSRRYNVPRQPETFMPIDTSNKPGIGLLGKGEENDWDIYDNDFHGGKKKQTRKSRKNKRAKLSRKSKKTKKSRKS